MIFDSGGSLMLWTSLVWVLFMMFHAFLCPNWVEGTTHESTFRKVVCPSCSPWQTMKMTFASGMYLLYICLLSMTNYENDFCKWYVASLYLFVLPVVHDKLWKWLLQVECIFSIFIAFSHKSQWKIRLVLPTSNTLN